MCLAISPEMSGRTPPVSAATTTGAPPVRATMYTGRPATLMRRKPSPPMRPTAAAGSRRTLSSEIRFCMSEAIRTGEFGKAHEVHDRAAQKPDEEKCGQHDPGPPVEQGEPSVDAPPHRSSHTIPILFSAFHHQTQFKIPRLTERQLRRIVDIRPIRICLIVPRGHNVHTLGSEIYRHAWRKWSCETS